MANLPKYRSYTLYEKFLHSFYNLLQTAKIHKDDHQLVTAGISLFYESFDACMQDDSLTIKISNDRFFIQDDQLSYSRVSKNLIDNMANYFNARELEGLKFSLASKEASNQEILTFVRLLNSAEQRQNPVVFLETGLNLKNIAWVEILKKPEKPLEEKASTLKGISQRREWAKKDYTYITASFKEVAQKVTSQGRVGMRKTVRVIQDMITHLIEDDEVYSAISTIRVFDDYTFTHSVNVAILSMCIGKRINLSHRSLERLGICALFHDLGKIEIPSAVLNKPGKLDASEVKLMEEHSLNSARMIAKLKTSRDRKAKILLPPFEHHLKYNLSGYPYTNWEKPLSLFGRIIAIADVYDAITSPRIYRKSVLSPDRALGFMLDGAGKDFDPILIKVFINILGVYPVGTLLRLDTGELALVVSASSKKGENAPLACLMEKDDNGKYKQGVTVNLAERNIETGVYLREIVESYHPSAFGIQPVEHIFSGY